MNESYYLKDLYPSMGKMFYTKDFGVSLYDSLLKDIIIRDYVKNDEGFTGILDVSESRFSEYSAWFKDGLQAVGEENGEEFEITANLTSAFEFPVFGFKFKQRERKIVFYNKMNAGSSNYSSGVNIYSTGSLILGDGEYEATMSFVPFMDNEKTQLTFSFDKTKGIGFTDFLRCLIGSSISIGTKLPSFLAYQEVIYFDQIKVNTAPDAIKNPQEYTAEAYKDDPALGDMLIRMIVDVEQFQVSSPWFKLDELFINLSYSKDNSVDIQSISMGVTVLGVSCHTYLMNPFHNFEIRITNLEERSVDDLLKPLELSAPDFIKGFVLKEIYLLFNPGTDSYYAAVDIAKKNAEEQKASRPVGGSCTLSWEQLSLALGRVNGDTSAALNMSLSLSDADKVLCNFIVDGTWENGITTFTGTLNYLDVDASIAKLYEAFFGTALQGLPTIKVQSLQITAKAKDTISVESFAGTLLVSVDPNVIGTGLSFMTSVRCDPEQFYISGQFVFQDYFQMRGVLEKDKTSSNVKWSFWLLLDKLEIGVSYNSTSKQLIGEIKTQYSLGDIVDYLLRLINPSDSFERTGVWSFLNDISLEGTQVAYSYADKSLRLTIKLSAKQSQSFIQMSDLTVIMSSSGVRFQIAGDFLGTHYTEQQPLEFAPNEPPEVSGSGLSVTYFLFGKGIRLPDVSGKDVSSTLSILEENFYGDMDFSTLTVAEKGGNFLGMDVDIAQTVNAKLLYLEDNSCCGGRFELYGDKAGALKGLSAELSYSKLNSDLGVFRGRFTPPRALQNIRLGALEFSIGSMGVDIYSNGDFALDLGYPYDQNFQRSFSFRYGYFGGSAGIYLKKSTSSLTNDLAPLKNGYFTNVLQMGIGMRLRVGSTFNKSILSAEASLVMQGCFEGVYARWMPDNDTKGRDYYELKANVLFNGVIQGRVDFGIVGAAVSLSVRSAINLVLSSEKPMRADITVNVKANASIKICFVRVNFSFSLDAHLKFDFSGKNGNTLFTENIGSKKALCIPSAWVNEEPVEIPLTFVPVFTNYNNRPAVALLLMAENKVFDLIIDKIAGVLSSSNALEDGEMRLFRSDRLSDSPEEIEKMLASLFKFVISAPKTNNEQNGVLMPIPEQMTVTMERYYSNGQRDVSNRDLQTYETMNSDYLKRLENYYYKTKADGSFLSEEGERGVEAYLFADFFELVIKAIRSEQENSMLNNRDFSVGSFTEQQYENIRGVVNRFFLGGRRGPTKSGPIPVDGLIRISGLQIEFSTDRIVRFGYRLQKNAGSPDWIQLEDGKKDVSFEMETKDVTDQLPAASYAKDIFSGAPAVLPAWQKKEEAVSPMFVFQTDKYYYFEAGGEISPGTELNNSDSKSKWGYGATFYLSLLREGNTDFLYRIIGYRSNEFIKDWTKKANMIQDIVFLYHKEGETDIKEWVPEGKSVVCIKNVTSGISAPTLSEGCADISDPGKWLTMVSESMQQNGEYFLYLPMPAETPFQKETELQVVLRFKEDNTYQEWKTLCYADKKELELVNKAGRFKQIFEQGMLGISADIDTSALTDAEAKLLETYGGMGAQLEDMSGKTLTNESPSFFGDPKDNKKLSYNILFPYAKALSLDQTDIYEGIGSGQSYVFRLFWSDILGNRMETGKTVSYTPKYQDRLMDPDEFPGISITASVTKNATLRLEWQFNSALSPTKEVENHLAYGCAQLKMPDVTVVLQSPLLEQETVLDKAALLAYLESLKIGQPAKSYSCEYPIRKMNTDGELLLLKAEANITIKRDPKLCQDFDDSVNISTAHTSLTVTGDKDETAKLGLEFMSSANENYVLTGFAALKEKPLVSFDSMFFFGFIPLPIVSGTYSGEGGSETLNSVSLRGILNQYLDDLAQITSAEELLFCYRNESSLRSYLPRIDALVRATAKALSSRVYPLYHYPVEDIHWGDIQKCAEDFFLKNMFLNRKEVIFVQMNGTANVNDDNLVLRGTIGKGDGFPAWYDLSATSDALCAALEVTEEYDPAQDTFGVRYIYDKNKKMLLTPLNPYSSNFDISIKGKKKIRPLLDKTPESPLLCSSTHGEGSCVLELHLNMTGEDTLLLKTCAQKATLKQQSVNSPVYDMEQYRKRSGELMMDTSPEGRKQLIELMEQYVKALEQFDYYVEDKYNDICLKFAEYENTGYQKLNVQIQSKTDLRIYISKTQGVWEEMTKQGDTFIAKEPIDTTGGVFLKIEMTGAGISGGSMQIRRSREFVEPESYAMWQDHKLYTPLIIF